MCFNDALNWSRLHHDLSWAWLGHGQSSTRWLALKLTEKRAKGRWLHIVTLFRKMWGFVKETSAAGFNFNYVQLRKIFQWLQWLLQESSSFGWHVFLKGSMRSMRSMRIGQDDEPSLALVVVRAARRGAESLAVHHCLSQRFAEKNLKNSEEWEKHEESEICFLILTAEICRIFDLRNVTKAPEAHLAQRPVVGQPRPGREEDAAWPDSPSHCNDQWRDPKGS